MNDDKSLAQFVEEYYEEVGDAVSTDDWQSEASAYIIDMARRELGYSDTTWGADIYRGITSAYNKRGKNGVR